MDGWLAQLEDTAHTGDLEKLQNQIRELRSRLQDDISIQAAASPPTEEKQG
jgi:nitrate reductase assembly molybdenum cofactor insertion protein NarJ